MALNALKCNHLTPLDLKALKLELHFDCCRFAVDLLYNVQNKSKQVQFELKSCIESYLPTAYSM